MAYRTLALLLAFSISLTLSACATNRESTPERTATEQLLISSAADRAADALVEHIPVKGRVFVDATNFEGVDGKYAIGTIRDRIARKGALLVADRAAADVIVEIRSGALSIDEKQILIGLPQLDIPVPLSGTFKLPEIALFSRNVRQGVAKFGATAYDAGTPGPEAASSLSTGSVNTTQWTALLFIHWTTSTLESVDP